MQLLGQIDDQLEIIQCVFIDRPDAIVDEERAEEKRKQKNLCIMVLVFIQRAYAFAIDQDDLERLALVRCFQKLRPAPEPLCARVDRRSDSEAALVPRIDNDAVEQE